jgi:hypothetical protein
MKLERRDVLKLAAGAAVAPGVSAQSAPPAAPVVAASPAAGQFFTARELVLLDELAEIIIPTDDHSPGARVAGVAGYLDRDLGARDPALPGVADLWKGWREGLAAVDAASVARHGVPFMEATPEQRLAVIEEAARNEGAPKTPLESFFGRLKGATAAAYYSSKVGLHQDMKYQGNTVLMAFVGVDPAIE